MGLHRIDNVDFYTTYKNNRVLTDPGSRSLAVRGEGRGEAVLPLANVTVTVDGQSGNFKATDKGYFQVKVLPAGEYNFRFVKSGFVDGKALVNVSDGERSEVGVVLLRK